ncbi:MAG: glycoside hydrolase family 15 protein [Candidatus Thermoplasmatota archaeon]|nr:glycoside hydrolase family 15 protein [Candidatus Thermoplasmatota archaeon]MCL5789262.1 glycoside hydrolase family 15 protein [Candidatus Thermoplasmatota archaeon]
MPIDPEFPRIEDHGVLLNNRTAALISKQGEVDFACFPNFDSEMVFSSILDREKGGHFSIRPANRKLEARQYYEPDTNILHTLFYDKRNKVMSIMDFLPMSFEHAVYFSEIHRRIETYADVRIEIDYNPFLLKDRKSVEKVDHKGYMVHSQNSSQFLSTDLNLEVAGNSVAGTVDLPATEVKWLVTTHNLKKAYPPELFSSEERLWQTRRFWKEWLMKSKYQGIFYDVVNRSLLTLKGLFFEPNSFMVASPTTSLPESIGGERNWDYRFMWVRDTSYVIEGLVQLGYIEEATKFYLSIIDRFEKDGRLTSIYKVSDDSIIDESSLDLSGYMNSYPVRIGNGASSQLQIDQYASLIISLRMLLENSGFLSVHTTEKVFLIGDSLIKIWREPDSSIWEIRGDKRNYVYSKALAWRALEDLSWLYSRMGNEEYANSVMNEARSLREEIYGKGISSKGYFRQSYETDDVDSALLRLPLFGFCTMADNVYKNTFNEIEERLMPERFLFKRYTLEDGLKGEDNAFLMVSFWYIRNLIREGRLQSAHDGLMMILDLMNDVSLLPEEIEFGTHRYLGNYPQAFSHLSLIATIMEYNGALKRQR